MSKFLQFTLTIFAFGFLLFSGCKKEEYTTDASAKLEFSTDTIMFDTVFTTVGSATEVFSVYNRNDNPIKISSIRLGNGNSSYFRLNVDGVPGHSFTDVEIGANDSMFIFVEVTLDPNNQSTPYVITDSIIFMTNGNFQDIKLVAWGQNAIFHRPPPNSPPLFFVNCNETWLSDTPHVIYGYALVDSGCTLTIAAGAQVFIHPGSGIIVLSSATLKVEGTLTNPVNIQGDRLGDNFKDVPGQWDRIWLSNVTHSGLVNGSTEIGPGSINSEIKYAIIKNGNIGLHVDTVHGPGETTLRIENTIVKNMASHALLLRGSTVKTFNSVFANCGAQTTNILFGGNYDFYHCTFANYWSNTTRVDPALTLNNGTSGIGVRQLNAYFGNCIITGNQETEIGLDSLNAGPGWFNFHFDHAALKVDPTFSTSNPTHYTAILRSVDPKFKDIDNNDYQIDSTSIVVDAGDPAIVLLDPILNFDLNGDVRPQGVFIPFLPDLGAYEKR